MNPVLNTTLPIGNATAPLMAPLPVQALDAAKPFEINIPNVAIPATTPTPTAPAPAQIAPGKMLKIEGVTPADTAIPADVIPAHAIELLAASAMREESPVAVGAEENPAQLPQAVAAQTAKPVWAFERYLPANPTPVARYIKPQTDEAAPEGEAELPADTQDAQPEVAAPQAKAKPTTEVVVECAVAPAIETPEVAPIIATESSEGDAPVQRELKPAKKQAEVTTDIVTPQVAPTIIVTPVAIAKAPAPEAKPVATATPVARPLPAKSSSPVTLPAAIAPQPAAETGEAVAIAAKSEAPIQRVIIAPKAPQPAAQAALAPETAVEAAPAPKAAATPAPVATPAVAVAVQQEEVDPAAQAPVAVAANPVAREALPVWSRPASPKLSKADGYAFVRTSVTTAVETPVSVARPIKEAAIDATAPVAADATIIAQTDTAAQILPADPKANDVSFGAIDAAKVANPLAQLSQATHVAQRHLDLARDTQWLDGLARDIVAASDRSGSMSFRLSPAHLGELDVALATSDAGLSVTMKTSSDEAAKIVHAAQPALVDTIQSQGVRVADAQVTSQADMSRHGQSQPQRQPQASFIETGFAASTDTETQNDEQPRGRFA